MTEREITAVSGKDHVLLRPGMYIGSIDPSKKNRIIISKSEFVEKLLKYVPGLLSAIQESVSNTNDHALVTSSLKNIWINADKETGYITIRQDGKSIKGAKSVLLAFGSLRASSTFSSDKPRIIGGQNGIGVTALNIFCMHFEVTNICGKKKTVISWRDNMSEIVSNTTTKTTEPNGLTVRFLPDYARFNMPKGIKTFPDTLKLLEVMAYHLAATTPKRVNVYYNDKLLGVKTFEDLVKMHMDDETPYVYTKINDRWEVAIALKTEDNQGDLSFVNGIHTPLGGEHVKYIESQVVKLVKAKFGKKKVRSSYISMKLRFFVKASIENPMFLSQTKESLTTIPSKFGSTAEIKKSLIDKFVKSSGIVESVNRYAEFQESSKFSKATDGKKTKKIRGIPKLEDANKAGTKESHKCTLMLVEGDSAKTMAISGLGVIGRNYYGVFPMKGKVLNTRGATMSQKSKNVEITQLKKILGLKDKEKYNTVEGLRYGRVMIMTDQDDDGSHIKGLLLSFFEHGWPELLRVPGFLDYMKTPIIRAMRSGKKEEKLFYVQSNYEKWYEDLSTSEKSKWRIRYVKGLGGHSASDAKKLFKDLDNLRIHFDASDKKLTEASLKLGFDKKMIEDRKKWLRSYDPERVQIQKGKSVTVEKFINNELVVYSISSLRRAIPSVVDGMVPSRRKVVFTGLQRNLTETKVAQLAGAVSERSSYHHGEASLMNVITGLAQQYMGSGNNATLFNPIGQFGSRILSGKDSASPRYIFTELAKLARRVFHPDDDEILDYLEDDGKPIEPMYYVPVIPLSLSQESEGIATGFSTYCPPHDPLELVDQIRRKLDDKPLKPFVPYFAGFMGTVETIDKESVFRGLWDKIGPKRVVITELPPKVSTESYKMFLEGLIPDRGDKGKTKYPLKGYTNHSTDKIVYFELEFQTKDTLTKLISDVAAFEKKFKISKSVKLSNMHCFDADGKIVKYNTSKAIFNAYFDVRCDFYVKRREHLLKKMKKRIDFLNNKMRFIEEFMKGTLKIMNVSKDDIVNQLKTKKYTMVEGSYDYLLRMPIYSLTKEKVDLLRHEIETLEKKRRELKKSRPSDIWKRDLVEFENEYKIMHDKRIAMIHKDMSELMKRMKR